MPFFIKILLSAWALIVSGCASQSLGSRNIVLEQDALVSFNSEPPRPTKAGEKFAIQEDSAALVELTGYFPLLIVGPGAGETKVRLKPFRPDTEGGTTNVFEGEVDHILGNLQSIQSYLKARQPTQALALAESLVSKYPRSRQMQLLKVSCLIASGQKQSAEALMKQLGITPSLGGATKKSGEAP